MSGYFASYFIQHDYKFLNKIITQFQQVLGVVPDGKYGALIYVDFNFQGTATRMDKATVGLEGLIIYLYYAAYGSDMPNIYSPPFPVLTDIEKTQIYSIYDAINVPRPSL
jgi:hypothetical protein